MSFSRNAASYLPRPRLRSQTTMSMTALKPRVAAHHRAAPRESLGRWEGCLSRQWPGLRLSRILIFYDRLMSRNIGSVADDTPIKVRQHARVMCGYRLPITLLVRADQFCIGQHVALHCSLDLRFCRAS